MSKRKKKSNKQALFILVLLCMSFLDGLLAQAKTAYNNFVNPPPIRINFVTPTPTPTPTPAPDIKGMIERGLAHWGSPPVATMSGLMASESQKYPILKQHPELLPVLSILESGGMRNMPGAYNTESGPVSNENQQFNGFGWGLNTNFGFNPASPEEVIKKVAWGIGNKPQFEKFRQTGKLEDLAQVYSPYSETNPMGGTRYVNNYNDIAQWFK
jgi:hypothetical protein